MRFQDRDDLEATLGTFFERVSHTEQAHLIHHIGGAITFVYHRPDGELHWVPTPDGETPFRVERGTKDEPSLLVFEQDGDTAHRFWLGRLNLQDALARQLVRARGPLSKAMKLLPHLDAIYPMYHDYLIESDRGDWARP